MNINERVGRTVSQVRGEQGLSADELASRSGVSRAMIYRIEAGQASPTVAVLNKLATGLGVPLPALLGPADYTEPRLNLRNPVASRRAQVTWRDEATGYTRRTLTPATAAVPLELSEVRVPAGARVTLELASIDARAHRQVWMLEGHLDVRVGDEFAHLRSGDCMAVTVAAPVAFHNPDSKEARYLLAITSGAR